jgi:hypothetical protein
MAQAMRRADPALRAGDRYSIGPLFERAELLALGRKQEGFDSLMSARKLVF